ncbi:hypothetical protein CHS0354_013431, partial [Potamilus streckersoni]
MALTSSLSAHAKDEGQHTDGGKEKAFGHHDQSVNIEKLCKSPNSYELIIKKSEMVNDPAITNTKGVQEKKKKKN